MIYFNFIANVIKMINKNISIKNATILLGLLLKKIVMI